jgi:predicted SAM-dependent methyltransferase
MKLHIGCGTKHLPGFVHVDITKHENVDHCCDIRNLTEVCTGEADEIYACHVLEHFGRKEVGDVLGEWHKVLKPGGRLRLAVPDVEAVVEEYGRNQNLTSLTGLLWGGQRDKYDYHTVGFDLPLLTQHLEAAGFTDVKRYDWRDFLPPGFDDYSRSYLPHLDFDGGSLMSLNVVATKR